jgi:dTDP-4-amino-4,6-dideoxygalactose transaminase
MVKLAYTPPVYSPLPYSALLRAVMQAPARDGRDALRLVLRELYGAAQVDLFASGTHALTAAIRAALARSGNTVWVALPAFACFDVVTAAVGAHARIIFYDVDPDTLGPDWDSLDAALTAGARIIVAAPLYGVPIYWSRLERLARTRDAIIIEDAAQSAGAMWQDRRLGSLGPLSVLSFGRGKGWTGCGGGALLSRGEFAVDVAPSAGVRAEVSTAASAFAQWLLAHPGVYGIPARLPFLHLGETRYRTPTPETCMARTSARLALATRMAAEAEAEARKSIAAELHQHLVTNAGLRLVTPVDGAQPGFLRYPVRVSPATRNYLEAHARTLGVMPGYPQPLNTLPAVAGSAQVATAVTGAQALAAELVTLPTHCRVPHTPAELADRFMRLVARSRA